MKGFAHVYAFELRDKRAVFAAALLAGLLVFPLAWGVHAGSGFGAGEARDAAAFTLALAWGLGLAAVLGATVIGRDLSEGRLSFYFSRPVSGLALWAGKMGAALTLAVAAVVLTLLPATLSGGGLVHLARLENPFFLWDWGGPSLPLPVTALAYLFCAVLVLAAAHALSVMVRSRSPLILLDAGLAGTAGLALAALSRTLRLWDAYPVLVLVLPALLALLLAALLAAGAVQVAAGRSDLKRGHKLLSLTLWPILLSGLLCALLFAKWFVSMAPSDLKAVTEATAASQGPWVTFSGPAKHRGPYTQAKFLLNTQTGEWARVGGWRFWSQSPVFSPDGRRAAWVEWPHAPSGESPELVAADLTGPEPKLFRPQVQLPPRWAPRLLFSPGSSGLALLAGDDLLLFRLPAFEQTGALRLPPPPPHCDASWDARFAGNDRLLLYQRIAPGRPGEETPDALKLYAFDAASRKLEATGSVPSYYGTLFWVSSDGGRLLTRTGRRGQVGVTLRDGRTGEALSQIAEGQEAAWPAFLPDGRIVVVERSGGQTRARVFSREGQEQRTYPLGGGISAAVLGEPVQRSLLFVTKPMEERSWLLATFFLLDLDTGKVTGLEGLRPASVPWWWEEEIRLGGSAGIPQTGLFLDAKGGLVRYDFATGQREVIVRAKG
jgi:hypothetical protein